MQFLARIYAGFIVETGHFLFERRSAGRYLVSLPVETDRGPATTHDVSVSGLYLVTDERLKVGELLEMIVTVPDCESSVPLRLHVRGNVRRVEEVGGRIGAGIELKKESARLVPEVAGQGL